MNVRIEEITLKNAKVPQSVALADLQKWLDYKKTKVELVMGVAEDEGTDDNSAEMTLIEAIMAGDLVLNEDMSWTYTLAFPVLDEGGAVALKSLNMKPRLTAAEVSNAMKGVDKKEPFKLYIGYMSALSGEVRGLINKLDSSDLSVLQKIVGYFL